MSVQRCSVMAIGAFFAGAAFAGNVLFPNGGFEDGTTGWKIPDASWSVVDGAGIGGSKALVVDIAKGERFHYVVSENFPIEPGTKYRFTAYLRNEGFKVGYGQLYISFGFLDANGKECGGCRGFEQADNVVGREGWACLTADSQPVPRNAVFGRYSIWAPAISCSGKMRLDDFSVEQIVSRPGVTAVHTSAYRDEANAGVLRIAAEYFANPVKYPDETLRGAFLFDNAGTALEIPAAKLVDGSAEASVDLANLPAADYALRFRIATKDGVTLGEKAIPFRRVETLSQRKVTIDAFHRTLVDGRLFFPLGMYWHAVDEKSLQTYTNGPFNCIMPYRAPTREQLDLAWKYGIRVLYPSQGHYPNARNPVKEAQFRDGRMSFKDHPAILAWYVCDELSTSLIPYLVARNLNFRMRDPDHPTWQVLNYPGRAREYMDGADVVGCDPYPICGRENGSSAPIGHAFDAGDKAISGSYGMRPLWSVPQMFNWGWYRKQHANNPNVRMPTREEMANMAWQCVAAGSNGLIFYSFFDVMEKEPDPVRREAIWQDMLSVVREVKKWEPVLLSEPSDLVFEGIPRDKLAVRVWRSGGEDVALVVNRSQGAVKAVLKTPRKIDEIKVRGAPVVLVDGMQGISVDFRYLDFAFVRIPQSNK